TTKTYSYSDNGNRSTLGGAETYDVQDRLVSNSEWNYTYNKNGYLSRKDHVTNGSWITYTYDALGNLLVVQYSNGTKVDYLVDGSDRRVRRRLNNSFNAAYIYRDSLRPVAQLNSNGTIKSIFIYGSKSNAPDLIVQGAVTYRVISDNLGSPLYVIRTSNGQIVQQLTYDIWGKVLSDTNPGFQPFGFAGGIYDSTTGLVRFGARDYDASIGRWLNKDPIRHEGGMNLYVYVGNSPINGIDPDGLQTLVPPRPIPFPPRYSPQTGPYGSAIENIGKQLKRCDELSSALDQVRDSQISYGPPHPVISNPGDIVDYGLPKIPTLFP
ncbi:MAG: RHS repeat-associated core domain-containing protein, partial [Sphingobacteriales bacterium]